jgi:hypothetical protein
LHLFHLWGKGKGRSGENACLFCFFLFFALFLLLLVFQPVQSMSSCFSASTNSPFDVYSFFFSLLHSCCSEYPSHSISLLHVSFICDVIVCLLSVVRPPLKYSLSLTTRSPYNDHAAVGNLSPSCIERLSSCILDHRVLVS